MLNIQVSIIPEIFLFCKYTYTIYFLNGNISVFNFILQLRFIFNIILYQFQVCSIVVRQLHSLQSVAPDISSTHVAPYIVIATLLNNLFLKQVCSSTLCAVNQTGWAMVGFPPEFQGKVKFNFQFVTVPGDASPPHILSGPRQVITAYTNHIFSQKKQTKKSLNDI